MSKWHWEYGLLQVAVRCRPLTVKEKLKSRDILRVLDDKVRLSVSLQKGTLGFWKLQQWLCRSWSCCSCWHKIQSILSCWAHMGTYTSLVTGGSGAGSRPTKGISRSRAEPKQREEVCLRCCLWCGGTERGNLPTIWALLLSEPFTLRECGPYFIQSGQSIKLRRNVVKIPIIVQN